MKPYIYVFYLSYQLFKPFASFVTYEFGNHPQPQSSLLVGKMYFQLKMLVNRCEKSGFSGRSAFCARCSLAKTEVSDQNGLRLYIIKWQAAQIGDNVVLFYKGATIHVTETGRGLKLPKLHRCINKVFNSPVIISKACLIFLPLPLRLILFRDAANNEGFHLSSKVVPLHGRHMTFNASWVWGMARNLALLRWFAKELVKKQWLGAFQYG